MKLDVVEHRFVDVIPDALDPGIVYVCIEYATALHQCCCGCGREVVTPLTPTDWSLIFDGETISLDPSIGNWSFPCQSHYWITRNRVRWAAKWTQRQIDAGRTRDDERKRQHYGLPVDRVGAEQGSVEQPVMASNAPPSARWLRIRRWLQRTRASVARRPRSQRHGKVRRAPRA